MKQYIIDRSITKRPCIYEQVGNVLRPVMYLEKAKNATDEEFETLLKFLTTKKTK